MPARIVIYATLLIVGFLYGALLTLGTGWGGPNALILTGLAFATGLVGTAWNWRAACKWQPDHSRD